jgi:protein-tyrosine-phosphatase
MGLLDLDEGHAGIMPSAWAVYRPARMMPEIVFLCTGNAARSVMATVLFRDRAEGFLVRGAGTHVVEGQPMSMRTRTALAALGVADPTHRSAQLWEPDARRADLLIAMAPEHVTWVRRTMPEVAGRTATLRRLVRLLAPGPPIEDFRAHVAALDLAAIEPEPWEEIVDPGGGEQDVFHDCARELDVLVDELIDVLGATRRTS